MKVDIEKLKNDIINLPSNFSSSEFKDDLSYFSGALNRQLEILNYINNYKEEEIPYYDKEETVENCTVQILSNSKTGDVSIGWWKNDFNT